MISLINKDVLRLKLPYPLPQRKFLTKALEWGIRIALFEYLFDPIVRSLIIFLSFNLIFSEKNKGVGPSFPPAPPSLRSPSLSPSAEKK